MFNVGIDKSQSFFVSIQIISFNNVMLFSIIPCPLMKLFAFCVGILSKLFCVNWSDVRFLRRTMQPMLIHIKSLKWMFLFWNIYIDKPEQLMGQHEHISHSLVVLFAEKPQEIRNVETYLELLVFFSPISSSFLSMFSFLCLSLSRISHCAIIYLLLFSSNYRFRQHLRLWDSLSRSRLPTGVHFDFKLCLKKAISWIYTFQAYKWLLSSV